MGEILREVSAASGACVHSVYMVYCCIVRSICGMMCCCIYNYIHICTQILLCLMVINWR